MREPSCGHCGHLVADHDFKVAWRGFACPHCDCTAYDPEIIYEPGSHNGAARAAHAAVTEAVDPVTDCNCASRGLAEEHRHGSMCPYGVARRSEASGTTMPDPTAPVVTWTHHNAHGEETRIEAYERDDRGWPGVTFGHGYFRNPDDLRDFAAALVEAAGWLEARNLGRVSQ